MNVQSQSGSIIFRARKPLVNCVKIHIIHFYICWAFTANYMNAVNGHQLQPINSQSCTVILELVRNERAEISRWIPLIAKSYGNREKIDETGKYLPCHKHTVAKFGWFARSRWYFGQNHKMWANHKMNISQTHRINSFSVPISRPMMGIVSEKRVPPIKCEPLIAILWRKNRPNRI